MPTPTNDSPQRIASPELMVGDVWASPTVVVLDDHMAHVSLYCIVDVGSVIRARRVRLRVPIGGEQVLHKGLQGLHKGLEASGETVSFHRNTSVFDNAILIHRSTPTL